MPPRPERKSEIKCSILRFDYFLFAFDQVISARGRPPKLLPINSLFLDFNLKFRNSASKTEIAFLRKQLEILRISNLEDYQSKKCFSTILRMRKNLRVKTSRSARFGGSSAFGFKLLQIECNYRDIGSDHLFCDGRALKLSNLTVLILRTFRFFFEKVSKMYKSAEINLLYTCRTGGDYSLS